MFEHMSKGSLSKTVTQSQRLGYLQRATVDYVTDKRRLDNGLTVHRPRKKTQLRNETRLLSSVRKFDDGCYTRMQ